uniref:Myosin heavy chain cardiac muscle isoform n=1 Tax=Rhizophora mucronata TaxID=61149 RepID=A0A2P2JFZ4_RHIMU
MWLSHHHEYFRLKSACDWLPIAQWKALSQKARASETMSDQNQSGSGGEHSLT